MLITTIYSKVNADSQDLILNGVAIVTNASGAGGMFCCAVVPLRRSSEETLCKLFKKSRVHKKLLYWC